MFGASGGSGGPCCSEGTHTSVDIKEETLAGFEIIIIIYRNYAVYLCAS